MTLVEVVVSLAIVSILAIFILTVFSASVSVIGSNATLKKQNENAAAGIENAAAGFSPDDDISVVERQTSSLEVDFGGVTITVDGQLIVGNDKKGDSKYYYFAP